MERFRHGRLLFVGDAAHQVSPFGARGANSGIQDTDNLCWKLKLVIDGLAPESLLDSYSDERVAAADENLLNSTRSTDFITPKSQVSRDFRNAVLTLAGQHAFARTLVNSGRLSVPAHLGASVLNTPDADHFEGTMAPGAPIDDAPVRLAGRGGTDGSGRQGGALVQGSVSSAEIAGDWLLAHTGNRFVLIWFADDPAAIGTAERSALDALAHGPIAVHTLVVAPAEARTEAPVGRTLFDRAGLAARRFDARDGTVYLLRPDQHVAARWRRFDAAAVREALARATGQV